MEEGREGCLTVYITLASLEGELPCRVVPARIAPARSQLRLQMQDSGACWADMQNIAETGADQLQNCSCTLNIYCPVDVQWTERRDGL